MCSSGIRVNTISCLTFICVILSDEHCAVWPNHLFGTRSSRSADCQRINPVGYKLCVFQSSFRVRRAYHMLCSTQRTTIIYKRHKFEIKINVKLASHAIPFMSFFFFRFRSLSCMIPSKKDIRRSVFSVAYILRECNNNELTNRWLIAGSQRYLVFVKWNFESHRVARTRIH